MNLDILTRQNLNVCNFLPHMPSLAQLVLQSDVEVLPHVVALQVVGRVLIGGGAQVEGDHGTA